MVILLFEKGHNKNYNEAFSLLSYM